MVMVKGKEMAKRLCNLLLGTLIYFTCFPLISTSTYQELQIVNPKVCNLAGKKGKIKLSRNSEAAVVTEVRSFDRWSGLVKFHCQFEVKDANDHAIFAVIQELKFRKENDECLDYVEFKSDDGLRSKKFCDEVPPAPVDSMDSPDLSQVAPYAFIGDDGELHVTVHVHSQRLHPDETLALKIAFTSAKKCYKIHHPHTPCGNDYCIPDYYANDSIVNCPFADCRDESSCYPTVTVPPYRRPSVGTKVTIGAITTVLVSFLLFFACIWVLRHYRKLCWATDFNARDLQMTPLPPLPASGGSTDHVTEVETSNAPTTHSSSLSPSAPPLERAQATILPDKDLPPSYDSLFPASDHR